MDASIEKEQAARSSREHGQESPLPDQELKESVEKDWKATRDELIKSTENHPRFAILPSPEKLDEWRGSPGLDRTATLRDFDLVKDWTDCVRESKLPNTDFRDWGEGAEGDCLSDGVYYGHIHNAFSTVYAPMRNTGSPDLEELVLLY